MPRELLIFGLLVPTFVPLFFVCLFVMWRIDIFFRKLNIYSHVVHPALFRIAVFVIVFCTVCLGIYG